MAEWSLAIDYGTSFTAAAIREGGRIGVLAFSGLPRMPSLVVLRTDGTLVAGQAAESLASSDPERVIATPKRRLGEGTILVGGEPVSVVRAASAVLRSVLEEARRQHGGRHPSTVALTHPADWGDMRLGDLRQAAADAGIVDPLLVPEPVAAALHFLATDDNHVAPGGAIGVYDLGGGTFDAAVLRRTTDGWFEVIATGGDTDLGGEDFDERVYRHLGSVLAQRRPDDWERLRTSDERAWRRANLQFRLDARRLKEDLSTTTTAPIYLRPPIDQTLQLTRGELEDLVREDVEGTLDALDATLRRAGVAAEDLAAMYLIGGSSRMLLLERLVRERFGKADTRDDPKAVVALGAAFADQLRGASTATPDAAVPTEADPAVQVDDRARAPTPMGSPMTPLLNPCPACGNDRPPGASACPTCFFDEGPRRRSLWPVAVVAAALALLLIAVFLFVRGGNQPATGTSPSAAPGGAEGLDPDLPPTLGSTALAAAFLPDPFQVVLVAGSGTDLTSASYLGNGCQGYVSSAPDYVVRYSAGSASLLRFYFVAETGDTAMIVNHPEGAWTCSDDSFDGFDPAVDFGSPQASGDYAIWIGTYAVGDSRDGTLYVTEDPDAHP